MISMEKVLMFDFPDLTSISQVVKSSSSAFMLVAFNGALVSEYLRGWNFGMVLKKLLIAVLMLVCFGDIFNGIRDVGFKISDNIVSQVKNKRVQYWLTNVTNPNDETLQKIDDATSFNPVAKFFVFLCKMVMMLTSFIYSIIVVLVQVFYPIIILLYLLPSFENVLGGLFKSIVWCALVPILIAISVFVLSKSLDSMIDDIYSLNMFSAIVKLVIFSLLFLFAPVFAQKIIETGSISASGSEMGKTLSSAGAMGAMVKGSDGIRFLGGAIGGSIGGALSNSIASKIAATPSEAIRGAKSFKDIKAAALNHHDAGKLTRLASGVDTLFNRKKNNQLFNEAVATGAAFIPSELKNHIVKGKSPSGHNEKLHSLSKSGFYDANAIKFKPQKKGAVKFDPNFKPGQSLVPEKKAILKGISFSNKQNPAKNNQSIKGMRK